MTNDIARLHIRMGMPLLALVLGVAADPHSLSGASLWVAALLWAHLITRSAPEPAEYLTDPAEDVNL